MSQDFGSALKQLREAKGLSRQGLASRIGYTYQYVWEQETGRKPPTAKFAKVCDHVLATGGALLALATGRTDVDRRTLLSVGALAAFETIRHDLTRVVSADEADTVDINEWEAIASEYGHSYSVTPASDLVRQLSADFLAVRGLIETSTGITRNGYCRVASQLAVITALAWSTLAESRHAWRWWRTARLAADASGDLDARMLCRGEEICLGLYEGRPVSLLLDRAAEAVAIGGDYPSRGTVALHAGIAQARAVVGHAADARAALARVEDLTSRLPASTTGASVTFYGWPETRVRHGESYVYTALGETKAAYAAQERALALYPDQQTIADVPTDRRSNSMLTTMARKVIDSLPETERRRDDVAAFAVLAGA